MSSELETQSTSDISSDLRQLSYIKIINDDDDVALECGDEAVNGFESNGVESSEQLAALPPDIQKLVDEAMKSSENLENQSKSLT